MADKKQTAGDFLSLYKDSAFADSRPPSQGVFPTTRDFLQPLERMEEITGGNLQRSVPAPIGGDASAGKPGPTEHVLPGGFGTYGADHVRPTAVKPEWSTCAPAESAEGRAEPKRHAFSLWEEEPAWAREGGDLAGKGAHQQQQHQRWPPPTTAFPAALGSTNGTFRSFPSSEAQPAKDGGRSMVAAAIPGSAGFADDDDEDEAEKPYHKEIAVKVADGTSNDKDDITGKEQKPSTPRSKHSATEQRRRTKINDRFQILRDLIPNSDQKRDKASFLLEVIEYIQLLQEKVQKYESLCPGWNPTNAKLMPWKSCQAPGASVVDHSRIIKDDHTSTGFMFPADSNALNSPTVTSNNHNVPESENQGAVASKSASIPIHMQYSIGHGGGFPQHQVKLISDSESMAVQPQSQWLRSSVTSASISTDVLSGHEELAISEGTMSTSRLYSERLMSTLTEALQRSGVDVSQARISVQINLRQQTTRRLSNNKDQDDPKSSSGHSVIGSSGDERERANKRRKSSTS